MRGFPRNRSICVVILPTRQLSGCDHNAMCRHNIVTSSAKVVTCTRATFGRSTANRCCCCCGYLLSSWKRGRDPHERESWTMHNNWIRQNHPVSQIVIPIPCRDRRPPLHCNPLHCSRELPTILLLLRGEVLVRLVILFHEE